MFSPYIKMSMFNGISIRIVFCDKVSPLFFVLYKRIKYDSQRTREPSHANALCLSYKCVVSPQTNKTPPPLVYNLQHAIPCLKKLKKIHSALRTVGFQSIEIAKKVFVTFDNVFHAYLMSGLKKYANIFFFTMAFFLNPLYPF